MRVGIYIYYVVSGRCGGRAGGGSSPGNVDRRIVGRDNTVCIVKGNDLWYNFKWRSVWEHAVEPHVYAKPVRHTMSTPGVTMPTYTST